jgi:hypothetical protein
MNSQQTEAKQAGAEGKEAEWDDKFHNKKMQIYQKRHVFSIRERERETLSWKERKSKDVTQAMKWLVSDIQSVINAHRIVTHM